MMDTIGLIGRFLDLGGAFLAMGIAALIEVRRFLLLRRMRLLIPVRGAFVYPYYLLYCGVCILLGMVTAVLVQEAGRALALLFPGWSLLTVLPGALLVLVLLGPLYLIHRQLERARSAPGEGEGRDERGDLLPLLFYLVLIFLLFTFPWSRFLVSGVFFALLSSAVGRILPFTDWDGLLAHVKGTRPERRVESAAEELLESVTVPEEGAEAPPTGGDPPTEEETPFPPESVRVHFLVESVGVLVRRGDTVEWREEVLRPEEEPGPVPAAAEAPPPGGPEVEAAPAVPAEPPGGPEVPIPPPPPIGGEAAGVDYGALERKMREDREVYVRQLADWGRGEIQARSARLLRGFIELADRLEEAIRSLDEDDLRGKVRHIGHDLERWLRREGVETIEAGAAGERRRGYRYHGIWLQAVEEVGSGPGKGASGKARRGRPGRKKGGRPAAPEPPAEVGTDYARLWRLLVESWEKICEEAQKEAQERVDQAIAGLLRPLLECVNDLVRICAHLESPTLRSDVVQAGVHLRRCLIRLGVWPIPTQGQEFNPHLHEAVGDGGEERGRIVWEVRKGYRHGGLVIRKAQVIVQPTPVSGASPRVRWTTSPTAAYVMDKGRLEELVEVVHHLGERESFIGKATEVLANALAAWLTRYSNPQPSEALSYLRETLSQALGEEMRWMYWIEWATTTLARNIDGLLSTYRLGKKKGEAKALEKLKGDIQRHLEKEINWLFWVHQGVRDVTARMDTLDKLIRSGQASQVREEIREALYRGMGQELRTLLYWRNDLPEGQGVRLYVTRFPSVDMRLLLSFREYLGLLLTARQMPRRRH